MLSKRAGMSVGAGNVHVNKNKALITTTNGSNSKVVAVAVAKARYDGHHGHGLSQMEEDSDDDDNWDVILKSQPVVLIKKLVGNNGSKSNAKVAAKAKAKPRYYAPIEDSDFDDVIMKTPLAAVVVKRVGGPKNHDVAFKCGPKSKFTAKGRCGPSQIEEDSDDDVIIKTPPSIKKVRLAPIILRPKTCQHEEPVPVPVPVPVVNLLPQSAWIKRLNAKAASLGFPKPSPEVLAIVSNAAQEHIKTLIAKLSIMVEHRMDSLQNAPGYELTSDIKDQLRFVDQMDEATRSRERKGWQRNVISTAKGRVSEGNEEKAQMKAAAMDILRAQKAEQMIRDANQTALLALGHGPRKQNLSSYALSPTPTPRLMPAQRIKRVHFSDVINLLFEEKQLTRNSPFLFRTFTLGK